MTIPLMIIALFAGATIATHIVVCIGIVLSRRGETVVRKGTLSAPSSVTVVIPAKDEQESLPALIKGLEHQSVQTFSVVFVNDRSADATPDIMEAYKKKHPDRVRILNLEENSGAYNPKQFALGRGIDAAEEGILLFTDADCELPQTWVEGMTQPFQDKDTGLVFGAVFTSDGTGFLKRFQVFDHAFRYYYTAGISGLRIPSGGFGNNLAVRTAILKELGGYGSIEETTTEDAALIAAVRQRASCCIMALTAPGITVRPAPLKTIKALARQELRWSAGAFFSKDPGARWGYAAVMIFLAGGLFALPFIGLFPPLGIVSAATFTSMLSVALAGAVCSRFPGIPYWLLIVPNILFASLLYTFVNILCLFKVPVQWKGKKLQKT